MKIVIITTHSKTNVGYVRFSHDLIRFLQKNNNKVVVICDEVSENLKGVKQFPILPGPLNFKKNYWFAWVYLFKLIKHRKDLKGFDLIHCVPEVYSFFTFLLSSSIVFFSSGFFSSCVPILVSVLTKSLDVSSIFLVSIIFFSLLFQ